MKAIILATLLIFGTGFVNAQKYAYIDSDYILGQVPAYSEAKDKLDKMADRWTKEIEKRYEVLAMKKENFARRSSFAKRREEKEKRRN